MGQTDISILSPQSGETIYTSNLVITGTATNAIRVEVCIVNVTCQVASSIDSWSVTFDLSPLPAADYTIRACAIPASGPAKCALLYLRLSQLVQTVSGIQTILENSVTPILAVGGVAMTVVVGLFPRWYRIGGAFAETLSAVVLVVLAIHIATTPFSVYYTSAAALFVAVLAVNRLSQPKFAGGM